MEARLTAFDGKYKLLEVKIDNYTQVVSLAEKTGAKAEEAIEKIMIRADALQREASSSREQ